MLATHFLIPYLFNDLEKKERFEISVGKGKNHGKPASSTPTTLSALPKTNLSFQSHLFCCLQSNIISNYSKLTLSQTSPGFYVSAVQVL